MSTDVETVQPNEFAELMRLDGSEIKAALNVPPGRNNGPNIGDYMNNRLTSDEYVAIVDSLKGQQLRNKEIISRAKKLTTKHINIGKLLSLYESIT